MAGIGNIYSDEILFAAHIRPARPANTLTKEEWTRLARTIPERLAYFIEKNAITPEEYLETTKGRTTATRRFYRSMDTAANFVQSVEKRSAEL